ncbi:hypothetical protein C8A00DRAFT_15227, partial [Chaetomidium leptoderma]
MERILTSQSSLLQQHTQDETDRRAVKWLNAPDVWKNLRNALAKKQPGTGDWFISSTTFKTWCSTPRLLWLTGIPGAGKTILSSTIIGDLLCQEEKSPNAVVFSFFDFQNASQQQPDSLLRSILMQLALSSPEALARLRQAYCDFAFGSRELSTHSLLESVTAVLTLFPKVFVVVDALDECSDRRPLLQHLKTLSDLPNVHLIALSRRERDIEIALEGAAHEVPLTAANVDMDIAMYIKHRIAESEDMRVWSPEDKKKVQDHLTSKAGGMFRWAQCQLDSLESCCSSEEIDEILASLPKDLHATYERILARLDGRLAQNVRLILVALAFSKEVL